MSESINEREPDHPPQLLSDAEQVQRMTNIAREACAGTPPSYVCWVEELASRERRMRQAINNYLPLLRDMANQIISPKDNSMSQLVKQFEKSLEAEKSPEEILK